MIPVHEPPQRGRESGIAPPPTQGTVGRRWLGLRQSLASYRHKNGNGRRTPVTSSRTTLQSSRNLALTGAVSRPSTLKRRPASLGNRQAPKASPLATSTAALVLCQIRSACAWGVHRRTLPNTSNEPITPV